MPTVTIPGRPLKSYPGLRFFYKIIHGSTILIRLPIWIAKFALFPQMRQLPKLSFKQSILLRLFTEMVAIIGSTETPVPFSLKPGKEGDRWVTFDPFSSDLYRGPLSSKEGGGGSVEPAVIGGTWYPSKPATDAGEEEDVILHFHGGAFVIGDGRTEASGPMFKLLQERAGFSGKVFAPQYRLSSAPTSAPFPAALQDSLTSYLYLVRTLGIPPQRITFSGDSAGGNLVVSLLRYIAEYGEELDIPNPGRAVTVAPWVDPTAHLGPRLAITSNPNYNTDYLGADLPHWGARTYIGPAAANGTVAPDDPYIAPIGHPFHTPVPLLVTYGSAEILVVGGVEWAREMSRVEGNVVEIFIEADAPHDTLLAGHMFGFDDSAASVAGRIVEFIAQHS